MSIKNSHRRGANGGHTRGDDPFPTRFKPGRSGNPTGRPKGSRNLSTYIMEAARDHVAVTVGGNTRKISKLQATAMQLATKAAGGDQTAMAKFLDWVDEIERRASTAKPNQFPLTALDIEVLREAHERLKRCDPDHPADEAQNDALPG